MIRCHQRNAPFFDPVQDQQRSVAFARHHDISQGVRHVDLPQPAAPCVLFGQAAGDRMAVAQFRDQRAVRLFDHPRGRRGGQHVSQWGPIDAVGTGEIRAGCDQNGPTAAHIIRNVFEIQRR